MKARWAGLGELRATSGPPPKGLICARRDRFGQQEASRLARLCPRAREWPRLYEAEPQGSGMFG